MIFADQFILYLTNSLNTSVELMLKHSLIYSQVYLHAFVLRDFGWINENLDQWNSLQTCWMIGRANEDIIRQADLFQS